MSPLREGIAKLGEPIFAHAPAEVVHARVEQFLSFVIQAAGPFVAQRTYAARAQEQVTRRILDPKREIDYAIAVADYCLFDEMRPDNFNRALLKANFAWTDLGAPYQRFYMYNSWFPDQVIEAVKTRCGGELTHLAIGFPLHVLHVQNGAGLLGLLTPEFAYWANGVWSKPPLGVCRQNLFASLLRCGINPFEGCRVLNTRRKIREEKEPGYIRKYRKLVPMSLRTGGEVERLAARTAQHWGALMGEPEQCAGETALLFNSGTSANESVVAALADVPDGLQFTHPFWYFESKASIERLFATRGSHDPARAQIAFLNLEPVTLHNRFTDTSCVSPQEAIQVFGERARGHASTPHILVIDVTLDPVFSVRRLLGGRLPENLCVVKTASVSKHQRGGRNYFFGAVTVLNDLIEGQSLRDLIAQKRPLLGGLPSDRHCLHCPRPSAVWLREKRRRIAALNKSLVEILPPDGDWRFFPFGYSSFFIPQVAVQRILTEHIAILRRRADKKTFNRIHWRIYRALGAALIAEDHPVRFPGIETGNSFGLPVSRVLLEDVDDSGRDEDMGRYGVRISPGFATDPALLQAYVREMLPRFEEAMYDLLSLDPQNPRLYDLSIVMSYRPT